MLLMFRDRLQGVLVKASKAGWKAKVREVPLVFERFCTLSPNRGDHCKLVIEEERDMHSSLFGKGHLLY